MEGDDAPRRASFAEKLDHLFQTVRKRGAPEDTYRDVAAGIVEMGGPSISPSYIWQLRTGVKDNPTIKHVQALANYFGVPAAYFFDEVVAQQVDAELAVLTAMRDSDVRHIALRAAGLSVESLGLVREVIERTRRLERGNLTRPDDDVQVFDAELVGGEPRPTDEDDSGTT